MRWPPWRRERHPNGGPAEPELSQLRAESEDRLRAAREDTVEARRVSGVLRRMRHINHLGPLIAEALRAPKEGPG